MAAFDELTLRRTSTAQQLADGLTDAILTGQIAPGEPLKEASIATSLGIARNTVREAVRILEAGGLVRREMHRSATVIEPTDEELAELYQARLRLETAAAEVPAAGDNLRAIRTAFEALERAAATHEANAIVTQDVAFHVAVVALLGSRRIDAFYRQIANQLTFFLKVLSVEDKEYEDPSTLLAEHRAILDAIESADPHRAAELTAELVTVNAERVRGIFRDRAVHTTS